MGMNRRTMMAAAGALPLVPAAAAARGARAVPSASADGTQFVIDLGGVTLPKDIADNLENHIRYGALMAVARAMPRQKFRAMPLPPGVRGIILKQVEQP